MSINESQLPLTPEQIEDLHDQLADMSPQRREYAAEGVALGLPDASAASRMLEPDGDRFNYFYPPAPQEAAMTTDRTISEFLDTYSHSDQEAEISVLERMIFNPVADYSQQLAREEEASLPSAEDSAGDSQDDRINRFILSTRAQARARAAAAANDGDGNTPDDAKAAASAVDDELEIVIPDPAAAMAAAEPTANFADRRVVEIPSEDTPLSESLAKIFIKTGRYGRAYEILQRISLAVPEKSAYFADQLRFLRLLMHNSQLQQQSKETR